MTEEEKNNHKTMKNKTVFFVLIVLGIILAVLIGVYFFRQSKPAVNSTESTAQENPSNTPANETGQPQNKIITDDFSIDLPAGWKQTAPAMGASAMAVSANENINDPAAQKINFKSYFAVSYDTFQGKTMNEYVQIVKDALKQTIPSVVFTKDQDMTINGKSSHGLEAELTQQGVNFKMLMVIISGKGDDLWGISFNTTKSGWDGYKDVFYNTANSFVVKN